MYKVLVSIIVTMIVLNGCGDGGSGDTSSNATSASNGLKKAKEVTQEDFNAQGDTLTKSQFLEYLYDEDVYMDSDNIPKESDSDETGSSCSEDLLLQEAVQKQTGEHTYTIEIESVDVSSCSSQLDKYIVSVYGSDIMRQYKNGEYENNFENDTLNRDIQRETVRGISSVYFQYDVKGIKVSGNTYKASTGLDDFSKPCTMENGHKLCKKLFVDVTKFNVGEGTDDDFAEEKVTYKEFKIDAVLNNGRYYDSGTISFKINNWSGVITFVDSNTPPTFSATDGTTELEGVLDENRTVTTKSKRFIPAFFK